MTPRTRPATLVTALTLAVFAGGCDDLTITSSDAAGAPAVQRAGGSPTTYDRWRGCPDDAQDATDPAAVTLPALSDFTATTAVRCTPEIRDGGAERVLVEERTGDLTALLDALRLPDEARDEQHRCTADLPAVPWLALLDQEGRWIRPGLPADSCAKVRTEVSAAAAALPWRTVASRAF